MLACTPELATLLASGQPLVVADLYTITLADGTALRWSGSDCAVTFGGTTWVLGPALSRGGIRHGVGLEVSEMSLRIFAPDTVQVLGTSMFPFLARGGLDGASLLLQRAYAPVGGAWVGLLHRFAGRISPTDLDRHEARFTVRAPLELLNTRVPRNLYQSGCGATLYDGTCGVSQAAYTVSGTTSGSPTRTSVPSAVAGAAGAYALGMLTFTSGANAGVSRTVRAFSGGVFTLVAPLPFAPAVGDTFTAAPGCDKTPITCAARFGNLARFRGQPYIPVPETVT